MTKSKLKYVILLALLFVIPLGMHAYHASRSTEPFQIRIVDARTGAAVPGIKLVTDNGIFCFTRADGTVLWSEDSLMNRRVYFKIESFPGGGKAIRVTHGGHAELKISR